MCVICVSKKGVRQPYKYEMKNMFDRNPDGAGFMTASKGRVEFHKGYMSFDEFWDDVCFRKFTSDDVVIYHFRISTQGGVNREMCHPFPLYGTLEDMKILDGYCKIGVTHNGIIPMTTDRRDHEYSDTARFVADYMPQIIRGCADLRDDGVLRLLEGCIQSKMAILDEFGYVATVGNFIEEESGLLFSNSSYLGSKHFYTSTSKKYIAHV